MKSVKVNYGKFANVLFVVIGLLLLFSCSPKPEDACLGKWSTDNGSAKIELFKDGKINIIENYLLVHGKYTFLDKDKIKVELLGYEHIGEPPVITIAIVGDEMTWTYPNGEILKYKKMS